ncbi:hypothetical protein D3C86_1115960 [compost metagenome]
MSKFSGSFIIQIKTFMQIGNSNDIPINFLYGINMITANVILVTITFKNFERLFISIKKI